MLFVMLFLVVALAGVCGAEYAMLKVAKAEHKLALAELKSTNHALTEKCKALYAENAELCKQMTRLDGIKEGLK